MKNIIIVLTLLIFSCNSVFAITYKPNGSYKCTYPINASTQGNCTFMTNSQGNIQASSCGLSAPSPAELMAKNRCSFTPYKMYKCKYQNGQCNVNITAEKGGYQVSCKGTTPDTKSVYQRALAGKCTPVK